MDNTTDGSENKGQERPKRKRKPRSDKGKRRGPMKPREPYSSKPPETIIAEPDAIESDNKATDLDIPDFIIQDPISALRRFYGNFCDFIRDLWPHAIPGAPSPTRIQYDTAEFLQHGPPKRIILGFRGYGKSYLAGGYWMWRLLQDPEERMKYLSGDDDKVQLFSNWCKGLRHLPNFPVLYHLRPRKGQKDDQYMWDVGPASLQQYPSFSGSTITSAIQGGRCTIGMLDDPEQKSNADSELKRARIIKHGMDVSNMLIPESRKDLIVLGNYQSLNSVYIPLIRERGFEPFFVPSEVPKDVKPYRGKLAPTIAEMAKDPALVGQSSEPTRFKIEELREQRRTIGDLQYQLEWLVNDEHGDRFEHPFPLDRMIVWDAINPHGAPRAITPGTSEKEKIHEIPFCGLPGDGLYRPSFVDSTTMVPYQHILMAVDPAGSASKDEAAWMIFGAVPGQIHLLSWGGRPNGVDPRTMREIGIAAKTWRVREIIYESNMQAWGSLFAQTLGEIAKADGFACRLEGVRVSGAKEVRIVNTIEPILYGGQLIVSRKALEEEHQRGMKSGDPRWQERLLQYQLAMFRRYVKGGGLEYDDRVDALHLGLNYLHERFLKTTTAAAAAAEAERQEAERDDDWRRDVWGETEEDLWVKTRR